MHNTPTMIIAVRDGHLLPTNPQTFPPDLPLSISWVKSLASLFGLDDSEPFSLHLTASCRAADHAEAVVDEPDHVVEVAVAVLQPGVDFQGKHPGFLLLVFLSDRDRQTEILDLPAVVSFETWASLPTYC
jgi:hypothetical protein